MGNEVQIVLTAVDKASATLKKVGDQGGMSMKTLGIGIGTAVGVASALGAAVKKTTDETVAYNLQVRNLAQNLGITTEETSRLIQAADDFGVSQENVTSALQMAVKKGFAPNIDTVANLADEYNSIEDPVKRAARMVEVFGRNWTTLTPMLREGGDAIREAYEGVADGMVVTEESAQAARDYQIAMDGLNDTFQAVKYTVGNELIPVLTDALNYFNDWQKATAEHTDTFAILDEALADGIITQERYNEMVLTSAKGTRTYKGDTEDLIPIQAEIESLYRRTIPVITDYKIQTGELATAEEELKEAADKQAGIYKDIEAALRDSNVPLSEKLTLLQDLKLASGELTQADIDQETAIKRTTTSYALGYIEASDYWDIMNKLATGAYTARDAMNALELAIARVKSKTVTITVKGNISPALGEIGIGGAGSATVPGASGWGVTSASAQQFGGPVKAGNPYLVGEVGPELFVPNRSGTIVSNDKLSGAVGGAVNNFYIQSSDPHGVAMEVAAILSRQSRKATYSGLQYAG